MNLTKLFLKNQIIIKNYIIFLLFYFTLCFPIQNSNKEFVHLIIDAGSSGTRFCPYKINYSKDQCSLKELQEKCITPPSKDGLDSLSKQEIYEVLDKGFESIFLQYKTVHYVSLLGTGGFRKLSAEQKKEKLESISEYFFKIPIHSNIKFISGEEESYFAWKSIEVLYNSKSHTILETGGATIQIAIGKNHFKYISLPYGINSVYQQSIQFKEFAENCRYGLRLNPQNYKFCKDFIKEKYYQSKEFIDFITLNKEDLITTKMYSSGTPWYVIFSQTKSKNLTPTQLQEQGEKICSYSKEDLLKKGIQEKYIQSLCYLYYYHSAQLESIGTPMIYKGIQSWTIGASISQKAIPYCKEIN